MGFTDQFNKMTFEKKFRDVASIGLSLAQQGLAVAKSSLETGAMTLGSTADILGDLSMRIKNTEKENNTEETTID